jgi:hypothetical protein
MMIIRIHLTLYQVSLSVMEHFDGLCCAPSITRLYPEVMTMFP